MKKNDDNIINVQFGEPEIDPAAWRALSYLIDSKQDTDAEVWDIKKIKIALGPGDDDYGFMEVEVFSYDELSFFFSGRCEMVTDEKGHVGIGSIPMDAARRLRDFLNYAIKD